MVCLSKFLNSFFSNLVKLDVFSQNKDNDSLKYNRQQLNIAYVYLCKGKHFLIFIPAETSSVDSLYNEVLPLG